MTDILPRWAKNRLASRLKSQRIISVDGPRQCGKTTLVKNLPLADIPTLYRSLDNFTLLQQALSDPSFFLRGYAPQDGCMIIDEIQKALPLIGEMKAVVDENPRPGQFIITGSADYRKLPQSNESLAGRVGHIRLRSLTEAEKHRADPVFLENLFAGNIPFSLSPEDCSKTMIVDAAIRGGFPGFLNQTDPTARAEIFQDYLNDQITHDMNENWGLRRPALIRSCIEYFAGFSSKILNVRGASNQLGVNWTTLDSYVSSLEAMYLIDKLPAWTASDYDAAGKRPKILLNDSGLLAHLLGLHSLKDLQALSPELEADRVGKLVETWVYTQLMPEIDLHPLWRIFHLRAANNQEIDFLLVNEREEYLGIEVKAAQTVHAEDFKHLQWFQRRNPQKRFTGIVLYAGHLVTRPSKDSQNLFAVPMAYFWER